MSYPTSTNFTAPNIYGAGYPTDITNLYVTKAYVMDNYPNLFPPVTQSQLYSWGLNTFGSLGDGTTTSNGQVNHLVSFPAGSVKQMSIGGNIAVLKYDGSIWTWGLNNSGSLGDSTTTNRSSPVQLLYGGVYKSVSAGASMTAAIDLDGKLWTWGYNQYGQLGDGTTSTRSSPVTVAGGNQWTSVQCAGSGNISNTAVAAIDTTGYLWMWGANYVGQLGDSTTTNRSSPVTVTTPFGGLPFWTQVHTNGIITSAIMGDGTLWCWGYNTTGQLGDGTSSQRSTPVQVAGGGTNWKQVHVSGTSGSNWVTALKTDGSMWAWGYNGNGLNFGIGSSISSALSPYSITNTGLSALGSNGNNLWKLLPSTGAVWNQDPPVMMALLDTQGY